jgi:hypothetical protein
MKAMEARLRGEMKEMEDRLRSDLGSEMKAMEARLRGEMKAMEARLRDDLGNEMKAMEVRLIREIGAATADVAKVMTEHLQSLFSILEEKYQDLPSRHVKLRGDFETHAADRHLHARSPAAPPKRVRRPRSR